MYVVRKAGFRLSLLALHLSAAIVSQVSGASLVNDHPTIRDAGQSRAFDVATDELYRAGPQPAFLQFAPLSSAQAVKQQAEAQHQRTGEALALVLYEHGVPRSAFTRRILTRQVLARFSNRTDAARAAAELGVAAPHEIQALRGWFRFEASALDGALALAEALRRRPGVVYAEAQLARQHAAKLLPDDPFFPQQWHLLNTGQNGATPGIDINVTSVWDNWRGAGVLIGIVDDGLQVTHPDLAPNVNTNLGWNFNDNTPDPGPNPNNDWHGTKVAGLAAARGNNALGVTGVAFEAGLVGLRLLGAPDTDEQDAAAMLHSNAVIHVKNNSWGAPDADAWDPSELSGAGPLMGAALDEGTTSGRGGKGEIYVFAGGNGGQYGDNVNYDGFANLVSVFAVTAMNDEGRPASYSEPGACLVVAAPSSSGGNVCSGGRQGITTTDLVGESGSNRSGTGCEVTNVDYTQAFGGTSATAPQVSGVIALLLQANPGLSYRDVKEILLRSATRVSPDDSDWSTNSAGIPHNHRFGAGLVNAGAVTRLATHWLNLGPLTNVSLLQTNLDIAVPDNDPNGVSLAFAVTNRGFRVEHAALTVTLAHQKWGDLAITLISPSGTRSRLAELHNSAGTGYDGWTLSTVRHWGEQALGVWTVQIADLAPANTGALGALQLDLYGSVPAATLTASTTNQATLVSCQAPAVGWSYALEASTNLTHWTFLTNLQVPADGRASFLETNASAPRRFYRARLLP